MKKKTMWKACGKHVENAWEKSCGKSCDNIFSFVLQFLDFPHTKMGVENL